MMEKEVKVTRESLNRTLEVPAIVEEIIRIDERLANLKAFGLHIAQEDYIGLEFQIKFKTPEKTPAKDFNKFVEVIYVDDNDIGRHFDNTNEFLEMLLQKTPEKIRERRKLETEFNDVLPTDLVLGQLNVLELGLKARKKILVDKLLDWGYLKEDLKFQ